MINMKIQDISLGEVEEVAFVLARLVMSLSLSQILGHVILIG